MRRFILGLACTLSAACGVDHTIAVGTRQQPITAVPRHRCLAACDHAAATGNLPHPSSAACALQCEEHWSTAQALCPAASPELEQMADCYLASDGTTTPTCQYLFDPSIVQSIDGCPDAPAAAAPATSGVMSGTNCSELPPEADACWFELTSTVTSETLRVDCARAPSGTSWSCACFLGDAAAFAEMQMEGEPILDWYTRCFSESFLDCFEAGHRVGTVRRLGASEHQARVHAALGDSTRPPRGAHACAGINAPTCFHGSFPRAGAAGE